MRRINRKTLNRISDNSRRDRAAKEKVANKLGLTNFEEAWRLARHLLDECPAAQLDNLDASNSSDQSYHLITKACANCWQRHEQITNARRR